MIRSRNRGSGGGGNEKQVSQNQNNNEEISHQQQQQQLPITVPSSSSIISSHHRRRRRFRSKKNSSNVLSSVTSVCCFVFLCSLMIVNYHRRLNHNSNNSSSSRSGSSSFLAMADEYDNNNSSSNNNRRIKAVAASTDTIYDIAILGAGPAGLTAAIFGAKAGLSVVILGSTSGLLSETPRLENVPGFPSSSSSSGSGSDGVPVATGEQWLQTARFQAQQWGANFAIPGLLVESLTKQQQQEQQQEQEEDFYYILKTQLETTTYRSKSVIIATGATPRRLNLPNEETLWGRNLHNCAICDGHIYNDKSKTVLVIGGGDAAIDAALYLSRKVGSVILVHRKVTFDKVKTTSSLRLLQNIPNIELWTPHIVTEWKTSPDDKYQLIGAIVQNTETGRDKFVHCDGAFLMIGATPNTEWLQGTIQLDSNGLIQLVHNNNNNKYGGDGGGDDFISTTQTSLSGVFAAGEVTDSTYKQAITAAAAGASAAMDAERWLRKGPRSDSSIDSKKKETKKNDNNDNNSKPIVVVPAKQNVRQGQRQDFQQQQQQNVDETIPSCDLTKPDCIQETVQKYPVVVFSKPW